jgi:ABC transporter substrate binding protein
VVGSRFQAAIRRAQAHCGIGGEELAPGNVHRKGVRRGFLPNLFRCAASYVDNILKGANPADLPADQPTKLKLVFNLKTAEELALVIPREFLMLADEVFE